MQELVSRAKLQQLGDKERHTGVNKRLACLEVNSMID